MAAPAAPAAPLNPGSGSDADAGSEAGPGSVAAVAYRRQTSYRETATYLLAAAVIVVVAHVVDVMHASGPAWVPLVVRLAWAAVLVSEAIVMRRGSRRAVLAGGAVTLVVSAVLFPLLVVTTGGGSSPLLLFGYVIAMAMPLVAFELFWAGVAGALVVTLGVTWIAAGTVAGIDDYLALVHVAIGVLVTGTLLGRALARARKTEEARTAELSASLRENVELVAELRDALASVRTLSGLLPMCAWCRRVRSDTGYWEQIEAYVVAHTGATVSHGLCPECAERNLAELEPVAAGERN